MRLALSAGYGILVMFITAVFFLSPVYPAGKSHSRGLFVSSIEDNFALNSREEIINLVDFAKKANVGVIFIQIYRANQSWFPSSVADPSPYSDCLAKVGEDPLALLIKEAHSRGIEVHAWLNMLSLSRNEKAPLLQKYGLSVLTRNVKPKNSIEDYRIDDQYFLEPGDLRIRGELVKLVGEILARYPDIDGLQFDYIRYPDRNPAYGFGERNVERFKKRFGFDIDENSQIWLDWKRDQVTEILARLVKKAKEARPGIQVSATGCIPYPRAYYEAFQDWPSWVNKGLIDFVTLMDYSPKPEEYKRWLLSAQGMVKDLNKVNVGIGAYKLKDSPETFAEELAVCEDNCSGKCVVFYYGSLRESPKLKQVLTSRP